MENDMTFRIGTLENPFVSSADIVMVDDKLYFYYDTSVSNADGIERLIDNSLYRIDITKDTLQKVVNVDVDQTLVYLSAVNGKVISYKGEFDEKNGITYLDILDVSDENNIRFDTLIQKEYDMEKMNGEIISHFSIFESDIYIVVENQELDGDTSWTMERYDLEGNCTGSWHINDAIIDLLNQEPISKFEVFGEYGYISNFSATGVVFRITSDEVVPEFIRELGLDIALPADNVSGDYAILFFRDTGEIWRLDIAEGSLYKLDLPYESLRCIYMSNDNKILIYADTVVYGEIAQFSTEGEDLLAH